MKKSLYTLVLASLLQPAFAQRANPLQTMNPVLFSFQEDNYQFQVGGFFQPGFTLDKTEDVPGEKRFNARRAFFYLGGKAVNEKVSFLIQTNLSDARPLMDAWVAWHPDEHLSITMGQKQHFANNAEMRYREDRLQFTDRSLLSSRFSRTGREFGLFVEGRYGSKIGFEPMLAVTSGDGRNSFGEDSRDTDLGGLKYAARLNVYPLGFFSKGNELHSADLAHEEKLKIAGGFAWSMNHGASDAVGEGHGNFMLYNENGAQAFPDYRQLYADLNAKYRGFSLLAEWVQGTASGLSQQFLDVNAANRLAPQQISSFLALGSAINAQLGYVNKRGYSADFRVGQLKPEFESYGPDVINPLSYTGFGLSKYFAGNQLKIQSACTFLRPETGARQMQLDFLVQLGF